MKPRSSGPGAGAGARPPRAPKPCADVALGLLARREHSVAELVRKLAQKQYARAEATAVVAELTARGLQSDARYAAARWRYRAETSRWGRGKIVQELKQAGVDAEVLAALLAAHAPDNPDGDGGPDDAELAWVAVSKKFKPLGPPPGRGLPEAYKKYQADKNRRLAFLLRRGFSMGHAAAAVARLG
jgi:regulatory protein